MDTRSELTVDIEHSIARAHCLNLSRKERGQIEKHLSFVLPKLKEPNSLISPVKEALSALASSRQWSERPLGLLVVSIAAAVAAAGIISFLGWSK